MGDYFKPGKKSCQGRNPIKDRTFHNHLRHLREMENVLIPFSSHVAFQHDWVDVEKMFVTQKINTNPICPRTAAHIVAGNVTKRAAQ